MIGARLTPISSKILLILLSTEAVEKLWIAPLDSQASHSRKTAFRVLHNQAASTDSTRGKTLAVTADPKGLHRSILS
jgi:hypothetical protein